MKRSDWAIVVTIVVAAAIFFAVVLSLRTSPQLCYYDHTVWLDELPSDTVPTHALNLTPEDLAAHPIIGRVVDAYHNPGTYPPARFEGEYFLYPVPYRDNIDLIRTNDYLGARWNPRANPVLITLGDEVTYSWEVSVSDPGDYLSCG